MSTRERVSVSGTVALVAAAGIAWLGPVPHVDPVDSAAISARVPEASAIPAWLADSEAHFRDLTPGTEKEVVWAGAVGERTPLAIVYLHGFSASRREISPVTEDVGRELGANVYFPRFAGHGRPGAALGEATATQWIEETVESIEIGKHIGDRVVLIGTSTGATLALAQEAYAHDPAVIGVVAISPNFGPKDENAQLFLWPWLAILLPPLLGDRSWEPDNELQARFWTTSYPLDAIGSMMAAVDHLWNAPLERFPVPTLFIWSDQDGVVSPTLTAEGFARLPADRRESEKVTCAKGEECHVLAGDILAPTQTPAVEAWILERIRRWSR